MSCNAKKRILHCCEMLFDIEGLLNCLLIIKISHCSDYKFIAIFRYLFYFFIKCFKIYYFHF